MIKTDIAIIGAGIAGICAANYLKLANADFLIFEGDKIGGKLNQLKDIGNFPALGKTNGENIQKKLIEQIENLDIKIRKENVQTILKIDDGFEIKSDKENYHVKKVIIATGNSLNSQTILGEEKYIGQGVSYCAVCDGNFFKNLDVAVVGNNNIALEEAIYLSNLAKTLYLVSPNSLIGDEKLIMALKEKNNVKILENSIVSEIVGDPFGVTGIKVDNKIISVSGVFPYLGKKTTTQILNNLKPNMKNGCLVVDELMMTNIKNLYGAGDIVYKSLKQLITAANDGAIAAISASSINL